MLNLLDTNVSNALLDCHRLIQPYIHRTPVLTSRLVDARSGASVWFKCENFQRMGAFKMRGAAHAILRLSEDQRRHGVVTHSSGNFAQALSLAAASIGCKAYIVMPENAPSVKKNAVRDYGGIIIECPANLPAREEYSRQIMEEHQATFIHPSDDWNVILGQGTAALELMQDHPDIERIYVPVGGGGLIAGCSMAAHYFSRSPGSCQNHRHRT